VATPTLFKAELQGSFITEEKTLFDRYIKDIRILEQDVDLRPKHYGNDLIHVFVRFRSFLENGRDRPTTRDIDALVLRYLEKTAATETRREIVSMKTSAATDPGDTPNFEDGEAEETIDLSESNKAIRLI
jgi:hypothetical protein